MRFRLGDLKGGGSIAQYAIAHSREIGFDAVMKSAKNLARP